MDPNETLRHLRYCARKILDESLSERRRSEYADETAELFQALDRWLVNGGFFPDHWMPALKGTP